MQKSVNNFCPPAHLGALFSPEHPKVTGAGNNTAWAFRTARRVAVSTTLWEAAPHLHQQQSGFAREVTSAAKGTAHACLGTAAIYPTLARSPTQAPFVICLSLQETVKTAAEFDGSPSYY